MPDHEARRRAVYDHDSEEPRTNARRRRQVADWGVGEELFDHMPPRRRFGRDESHPPIPRGGADDGRRTIKIRDDEPLPPATESGVRPDEEFASREDALRAREQHDEVWAGDEPFAPERESQTDLVRAQADPHAPERAQQDAVPSAEPAPQQHDGEPAEAGDPGSARADARRGAMPLRPVIEDRRVEGRRTVKIGGFPGDFAAPARQRPPRTVSDRVGHRPARFAAWAFALGLLLILVAVATAVAGT
jgi:hypothetical protein